jgi:hypothetical protein
MELSQMCNEKNTSHLKEKGDKDTDNEQLEKYQVSHKTPLSSSHEQN